MDLSVDMDYTRFESNPTLTGQPNAQRTYTLAQLSRPWALPGAFVTPKVQVHAANYIFDGALSTGATSANPVVPTFSVDSGLIFERDTNYFGRDVRQTLEPRAFYVYTPYRSQNALPNYDTASFDFNFTTIYTENAYVGNDRIADNNLLTLGLSTRLVDAVTGAQLAQVGIAQRPRFSTQLVTLPGQAPIPPGWSDMLVAGTINWSPTWNAAAALQFDARDGSIARTTVGASYNPGNYRVFNAAYRLQAGVSESLNVAWQWQGPGRGPLVQRWPAELRPRRAPTR
jgi:LPS-assembly protein